MLLKILLVMISFLGVALSVCLSDLLRPAKLHLAWVQKAVTGSLLTV